MYDGKFSEYQLLAKKTAGNHGTQQDAILNWTLGLAGEAGEVAKQIKKHVFHLHAWDYGVLIKELGDTLWYLAMLCNALGIDMEMVADQNLKKLARRYPGGFTSDASINRED
jgi:NTP pyrophosphatase (non-canonical NTP hydrolase)